jgi:putative transcriptional regulator
MDSEIEQFCNDLLQSVQEMKTATTARKTEFVSQWEQGRKHPSGEAKTLLKVAKKHPDILQELMRL